MKVKKTLGYWVLVEPSTNSIGMTTRQMCERIVDQVKRHVDGVQSMKIQSDIEYQCSFCGSKWTEDAESSHNGGCCVADCKLLELLDGDR